MRESTFRQYLRETLRLAREATGSKRKEDGAAARERIRQVRRELNARLRRLPPEPEKWVVLP